MSECPAKREESRGRHGPLNKTCSMIDRVDYRVGTDVRLDWGWEPA